MKSNDFEYNILDDGTALITAYHGNATELKIPHTIDGYTVTNIGYEAFAYCASFKSVTIPNSIKNIGKWAFAYCASLEKVIITNSIKEIKRGAFFNCASLTSVTIGNSVTSIGDFAFNSCTNLTSITIPNSVTSIGKWACGNCPAKIKLMRMKTFIKKPKKRKQENDNTRIRRNA